MSGYVEAGYSVVAVILAVYSLRVALRSRALRSEPPSAQSRDLEAQPAPPHEARS